MHEEAKKQQSPNVRWVGLLTFVLVMTSVFLGGAILSRRGIGVVGKTTESTQSPVGVWELPNGAVQRYRADGTGSATGHDGSVTHFEWRLNADKLALYYAYPNRGARLRIIGTGKRVLRGIGLGDEGGLANYVLVGVTSEKITLAIDDEPAPPQQRGDRFEGTDAATEIR